MIFLILGIYVNIYPNPIKVNLNARVPVKVIIRDNNGNIVNGEVKFKVSPKSLGKVKNGEFISEKEGKGILIANVKYGNERGNGFAYVIVNKNISYYVEPSFFEIKDSKGTQFKVTPAPPVSVEWRVIPKRIGSIDKNGNFTPSGEKGRGRIVALIKQDGKSIILSVPIITANLPERLIIMPRFTRTSVNREVRFRVKGIENAGEIQWQIQPQNIGKIENGVFTPSVPGKALITAKVSKQGKTLIGKSIVVVGGGVLTVEITPQNVLLRAGETKHFRCIVRDRDGNVIRIPLKWKVIPRRMGTITPDGTFTAGVLSIRGKVVAIVPPKFGRGIGFARVAIRPKVKGRVYIRPKFTSLNSGQSKQFILMFRGRQVSPSNAPVPIRWNVQPQDFGTITQNGVFTPARKGIGVITVSLPRETGILPDRAFVVCGINPDVQISPDKHLFREGESIKFSAVLRDESGNIIPADFLWRVKPPQIGIISPDGMFKAAAIPMGKDYVNGVIIVVAHKRRQILGWGKIAIRVHKNKKNSR